MVHADHLGRPIRMTDAARTTVWQAFYNPFGEPYSLSGTIENNLRFPGQVFLIETGLSYNWHRHYDPTTGRYTQPDPLRFVDGPSVYAYAGASPEMNFDQRGLANCTYSITNHTMTCVSNNGAVSSSVGPSGVSSGLGLCKDNPSCSGVKDAGPIPPGNYRMNSDDRPGHEGRWRLEPDPPVSGFWCYIGGRCGFQYHAGHRTLGCINADADDPNTMNVFLTNQHLLNSENGNNMLTVNP